MDDEREVLAKFNTLADMSLADMSWMDELPEGAQSSFPRDEKGWQNHQQILHEELEKQEARRFMRACGLNIENHEKQKVTPDLCIMTPSGERIWVDIKAPRGPQLTLNVDTVRRHMRNHPGSRVIWRRPWDRAWYGATLAELMEVVDRTGQCTEDGIRSNFGKPPFDERDYYLVTVTAIQKKQRGEWDA